MPLACNEESRYIPLSSLQSEGTASVTVASIEFLSAYNLKTAIW